MPKKANNYITISYKVHLISVSENNSPETPLSNLGEIRIKFKFSAN